MQVPRIQKITLNMGVGEAKTDSKALDAAIEELTTIAGQRAQMRRAKKSVASFKLREGMPIGARVTLRGARMWEFLDRLVSIALPRIRDFRGLNPARSTAAATTRSASASRSSFRRSTTTRSPRSAASTSQSRPAPRTTSRRTRSSPRSACRSRARTEEGSRNLGKEVLVVKQARPQRFKVRNYSRCNRCGRPRAVFRKFGLCRICLRELAHQGAHPRHDEVELVGDTMLTDPVADMLTRIRNANKALQDRVVMPTSQAEGRDRPPPEGGGLRQGLPRRARRVVRPPRRRAQVRPQPRARDHRPEARLEAGSPRLRAQGPPAARARRHGHRDPVHLEPVSSPTAPPQERGVGGEVIAFVW